MKNVAAYVRVSTQEQADGGYSIGEQQDRLRKYCDAQGWNLVHTYTDPGYSGAKLERPALQQLLADIPSGAFDTVLVFKLDRLSRSQKDTMYLIEDQFIKNNIDFCSVMESSLNTSTPLGKAMVGILSVFAQLERNNIAERMTMGRVGRAKTGKYSGGSVAPFGYSYSKDIGELIINEDEAVQVRLIYDLFLHGLNGIDLSFTAILNYMSKRYTIRGNKWLHTSTIARIIQNPVYCGMVKFSGKPYPGTHEPIISVEMWNNAQAKYNNYLRSYGASSAEHFRSTHLLAGLIKCGLCGGSYGSKTARNRHKTAAVRPYNGFYECRSKYNKDRKACSNVHYEMWSLEEQVINEIRSLSLDPNELKSMHNDHSSTESIEYIQAKKHLDEIDKQVSKLLDLYQIDGIDISAVASRIKSLNDEKDRTNVIISEYEKSHTSTTVSSVQDAVDTLLSFDDVIASGNKELLRSAIRALIDKIVAYPDHIEIHWSFA